MFVLFYYCRRCRIVGMYSEYIQVLFSIFSFWGSHHPHLQAITASGKCSRQTIVHENMRCASTIAQSNKSNRTVVSAILFSDTCIYKYKSYVVSIFHPQKYSYSVCTRYLQTTQTTTTTPSSTYNTIQYKRKTDHIHYTTLHYNTIQYNSCQ